MKPIKKTILVLTLVLQVCYTAFAQEQVGIDSLYDLSLEELMNMEVITASKVAEKSSDAPGVITNISAREIEQFGAVSLVDILERVTGVVIMGSQSTRQNSISFRGDLTDSNNHALILINGRPNRESIYGGTDFSILLALPISAIDRIEVIRGPGSVLYGSNAFSGVVNIILKKGGDQMNKISTCAGSFGGAGFDGAVGYAKDDLNVMVSYKKFEEKGWNSISTDGDGVVDTVNYGEKNNGLTLMLGYKGLTVNSVITESEQTVTSSSSFRAKRYFTDIGYEVNYGEKASTKLNATINTYDMSGLGGLSGGSNDMVLEVTNFFKPTEKLNVVLGGSYFKQTGNLNRSGLSILPNYEKAWYNGYLQADYRPISPLKLIAGLQINKIEGIDVNVVPRFGAIYNITDKIGTKVLYGHAFRAAYGIETDINVPPTYFGNKNLKPETMKNLDVQFYYTAKNLSLAATYFNNSKENNIVQGTVQNTLTYTNAGTNKAYGFELEGKYAPATQFYITGSYAYQTNELIEADGTRHNEATLMPNNIIKLGLAYQSNNGISLGLYNMYVSAFNKFEGQDALPGNNGEIDGFNSLSANLSINIPRVFSLGIEEDVLLSIYGTNLLDESISTPEVGTKSVYSMRARSGRALYVTLAVKF